MNPRARSVYLSKFMSFSLGLLRPPDRHGRSIVIGLRGRTFSARPLRCRSPAAKPKGASEADCCGPSPVLIVSGLRIGYRDGHDPRRSAHPGDLPISGEGPL